jgi:hypothetical protein
MLIMMTSFVIKRKKIYDGVIIALGDHNGVGQESGRGIGKSSYFERNWKNKKAAEIRQPLD